MSAMPALVRRLATLTLLGLLVGAAGAAGPVEAALADSPQVTVITPGGVQHTLSLEALAGSEDVVGRNYILRSGEGESSEAVTGFSIAALLDAAGVDPYGFSYVEVQRPGGGAVQLSRTQAIEPRAFADGPPVVYGAGTATGFLRPDVGPEDDNAADSFRSPAGLTIVMRKGPSLQVRIEATPRHADAGKKVSFRAVVERSGSGEALDYSWYFDDGNSGAGQTATHAFAKPGSYAVVVGVTAAGEDTGTSAVVRIQVGKAAGGGPDRQGGGHNRATDAPDHGAAAGRAGPAVPSATTSPVLTPAPEAVPPATVPTPETKQEKAKSEKKPRPKKKLTPRPTGKLVTGELLATSVAAPPPATAAKRAAARTGTPSADDGAGGSGAAGVAWGLGAVLALLGVGALAEAGSFVDLLPRIRERLR